MLLIEFLFSSLAVYGYNLRECLDCLFSLREYLLDNICLQKYTRGIEKGSVMSAVFGLPLSCSGMSLGPGTLTERWSQTACAWVIILWRNGSHGTKPLGHPTVKSVPWGEQKGVSSTAARRGRDVFRLIALCGPPTAKGPTGHGEPMPTVETDLALSLFFVNEVLSDIKMQWVEVFGFHSWDW